MFAMPPPPPELNIYSTCVERQDSIYNCCRFGNFCENFIFAKSVKSHICDVKNSQLGHDISKRQSDCAKSQICDVSRKQIPRENFRIYNMKTNADDFLLFDMIPSVLDTIVPGMSDAKVLSQFHYLYD